MDVSLLNLLALTFLGSVAGLVGGIIFLFFGRFSNLGVGFNPAA
jgi:hypothetical protein